MKLSRAEAAWILVLAAGVALVQPKTKAAPQDAVASIDLIYEGKKEVPRTAKGQVIRANSQKVEPSKKLPLFGQDQVETFSARMRVRYASDKEQILILDPHQRQVIAEPGLLSLLEGRLLALIEGRFAIRTPHVVVGVEGTDFLVEVTGERTRVTVFEGLVSYRIVRSRPSGGDRQRDSATFLSAPRLPVPLGESARRRIDVILGNGCKTPQQFRLSGFDNLDWARPANPQTATVAPGMHRQDFYVQLDAANVPAGIYLTTFQVGCTSCGSGACQPTKPLFAARRIEILAPQGEASTAGAGTQIDFKVGKPAKPKKVNEKKARQLRQRFEDLIPEERRSGR